MLMPAFVPLVDLNNVCLINSYMLEKAKAKYICKNMLSGVIDFWE